MRKHDRSWPGVCRAFQHHRSCIGTALKCPGMCATAEPARPAVEIPLLPAPAVASVAAWPWRGRRRRERSRNGAPGAAPNGSSSPPARRAGCCRCVSAASSATSPTSANRKGARSAPEQPRAGPAAINIIVGFPARRRRTSPPTLEVVQETGSQSQQHKGSIRGDRRRRHRPRRQRGSNSSRCRREDLPGRIVDTRPVFGFRRSAERCRLGTAEQAHNCRALGG
jgi:hypothetical protein